MIILYRRKRLLNVRGLKRQEILDWVVYLVSVNNILITVYYKPDAVFVINQSFYMKSILTRGLIYF